MPGLLVTATDTGVGKTLLACAIVQAARKAGLDVGAMKPAESGCENRNGVLFPADGDRLRRAAGGEDSLEQVCPFRLEAALAPGIAASLEEVDVDLDLVELAYRSLSARHPGGVVVEGAGGLLVPIDPGMATVADLAIRLSLPAVVVGRRTLGTINHTVLTVEALSGRGIECRGVILTGPADASSPGNAGAIERLADVPVIAVVPAIEGASDDDRIAALARDLPALLARSGKLDLPSLLA